MKSQWEQFLQQQQEQQQRMQQAGWMEQQRRQQQMAQQTGKQVRQYIDQRLSQVVQQAAILREQFAAGKLSQETLEKKLRDMMVQDADGTWWMVGTESSRWYRYDGKNWVPGTPPSCGPGRIPPSGNAFQPQSSGGGSKIKAFFVFIVGLLISIWLFFLAVWAANYMRVGSGEIIIGGLAGLAGLIISWSKARKVARGH